MSQIKIHMPQRPIVKNSSALALSREESVVAAVGVSFSYGKGRASVKAIQDLNWKAENGRITTIIGPSGCGKSTLLRGICGINCPDSGSFAVNLPEKPSIRDLTITFQTPALLPWLSVEANALLPFALTNESPSDADGQTLEHLLRTTGLMQFRGSYPHELSGGMAMRAAVVRAFLPRPKLVLMDEPFAALDEFTRERMCGLLEQIWMETQNTVIFVTHNLTEAVLLSDRVTVLSARPGKVIAEIEVPLPRPRSLVHMQSDAFISIVAELRQAVRGEMNHEI
jgi:NitT/TauT family transport system ATP-binding protein